MTDEEAIKEIIIQRHKAGIDKFFEEIVEKLKFVKNDKKECQEMTDEEIIKEFELFIKHSASEKVLDNVLDLISRQQAEIDKLKIEICALSEERITFPERLKIVKHARTETIKEFVERLIRNITMNNTNDGYLDYSVDYNCLIEDINDLVKEMTEGE